MPVYVQHEVLSHVGDVFNAEAIWQAPGLALFARKPLLRDLLERSPREHRGRAATRCFAHVTLMLPQEEVDDDRHLTRGARARDLADTLRTLHQKDFGDLLGGDEVRYDVIGTEAVPPGAIEVKFGHAVYLPAPDERPLYQVSASRDSAIWKPVCAIYPNQRLALIGRDTDAASHAVPGWPFDGDGGILLINDGPDSPLEVQVRPKDSLSCTLDPLNGCYTVSRSGAAAAARLFLKFTRVAAPAAAPSKPAAVWKSRRSATPEATAVPPSAESEATYAPLAQQRVSLAALALPRMSRYRDTGAVGIDIGLDAQLAVTATPAHAVLHLSVDGQDELYASSAEGRQRISAPASFTPVDARAVTLAAAPGALSERYCALLSLPAQPAMPVSGGARLVFGRGAPALASLRVLDGPRFLQRAEGPDHASADRLGLSRQAFSFELAGKAYKIARLSATQALFHLDDKLGFVAAIGPATLEQPYLLPAGHHLVAGHYVLRFDA